MLHDGCRNPRRASLVSIQLLLPEQEILALMNRRHAELALTLGLFIVILSWVYSFWPLNFEFGWEAQGTGVLALQHCDCAQQVHGR